MKTIKEAEVLGKRVILRADLDVPIEGGRVGEDYRLRALLPTLKHLLGRKARVLIIGHAGRPKGRKNSELSLAPVAKRLAEILSEEIGFVEDIRSAKGSKNPQKVVMLENLRFWPGEERGSDPFARKLASAGDIFVNEAFAVSHRSHASIAGISQYLPSFAGFRLAQEVRRLGGVMENPKRPLVFILGGAKTETKAPLVPAFAKLADQVLLGGLLMFHQELERVSKVVFPPDAVDAYDIGPKSVKLFTRLVKDAKTVVWNGPMGVWEKSRYTQGTRTLAEELGRAPAETIVGGGDTIAALNAFDLLSKMDYVSLGGGAMLKFLAGRRLPGLEALGYYQTS